MSGDALSRVRARGHIGIRLGLERMGALLRQLDDPQRSLRGALIAGTNGKGSVAAMVEAMLLASGRHVSRAPSPHLQSYRERVTVDGEPIAANDLDALLDDVLVASVPGERRHGPATEFELLVAAAFLWSARIGVDVAVIEVGLGGRMDATNSWSADVAAITNVSLDHQEYLGDTVELIAAEKAAIIKPGCHAVTAASGSALEVVRRRARELSVPLSVRRPLTVEHMDASGLVLGDERLGSVRLPLLGRHQAENASTAIGIVDALAEAGLVEADVDTLRAGLAATRWPGRLEMLTSNGTTIVLDGAHNPEGAAALALAIDELAGSLPEGPATLMLAVMEDKDLTGMVSALARSRRLGTASLVATSVPDTRRSLSPDALTAAWNAATATASVAPRSVTVPDPDEALDRAIGIAATAGGPLVIAGSLYLVGHVRTSLIAGSAAS